MEAQGRGRDAGLWLNVLLEPGHVVNIGHSRVYSLHAGNNSVINRGSVDVLPAAQAAAAAVSQAALPGPLIPLDVPQVERLWYDEIWMACCSGM